MMTQGYTATLVAATLAISRSSLYYRKRPRGSRADRTYDEQIVVACGEKLAYGYRRVAWWLQRKEDLRVNRKRVLRVMRERGLLVHSRRLRARRKKEWGRVAAAEPNQIWQTVMTKIWAGPAVGWAYLVCVIDCCTREIVGWNLSHRCRTEEALDVVEQAVLERLRAACLALPETDETISHGIPAFRVAGKMFAYFRHNHHGDGMTGVCVKTTGRDEQERGRPRAADGGGTGARGRHGGAPHPPRRGLPHLHRRNRRAGGAGRARVHQSHPAQRALAQPA